MAIEKDETRKTEIKGIQKRKLGGLKFTECVNIHYLYSMRVKRSGTGKYCGALVLPVDEDDYDELTKEKFFFDWKKEGGHEVYKLCLEDSGDILGLVSIDRIPAEWRIHIRLLSVSWDNMGVNKRYQGIVGNLFAFTGKIALQEYGELACVSLIPKTALVKHYLREFGMTVTGMTLSMHFLRIMELIDRFDYE